MKQFPGHSRTRRLRSGLGLIEVVISTLLVGVVLVGAMNLLGAVVRGRMASADLARAHQYAQQLMAEIMSQAYAQSTTNNGADQLLNLLGIVIGQEARSQYNDVDDYHGWDETPLFTRSGGILPNTSGWRRRVEVVWVNPANPGVVVASDQGVKRITVTVSRNGQTVAELRSLRSNKYPPVAPL
jgi:Tfp pilus assembly protein PilV